MVQAVPPPLSPVSLHASLLLPLPPPFSPTSLLHLSLTSHSSFLFSLSLPVLPFCYSLSPFSLPTISLSSSSILSLSPCISHMPWHVGMTFVFVSLLLFPFETWALRLLYLYFVVEHSLSPHWLVICLGCPFPLKGGAGKWKF